MLKKVLMIFVMVIALAGGSVTRAAEGPQAYLAEIDAVINAGDMLYTIYPGISLDDMRENFKGATQWTIADARTYKGYDYDHTHKYVVYRNIGVEEPVYEVIWITSDMENAHVKCFSVNFFTKSERIARSMFNKATNEYKIKYGTPTDHMGRYHSGISDRHGHMCEYDSMDSYVWSQARVRMTGWEHMEGETAEQFRVDFGLPQAMTYRVIM